ncbi:MAG: TPM domain-containing protein [Bacteroidetes bacterium]|nr:MAG: TPM domain-containing protein [Bacteroidota bacterium]
MSIPAKHFFTDQEQQQILGAIREAELNTSGEIRVHVENQCKSDVLDRAAYLFRQLNMHRTRLRNGVLFYLSVDDRKFAILGDVGLNQKVATTFWDEIQEEMAARFREGEFSRGLSEGIREAGKQLKTHFPYQKDDMNELSDEISFGKE